MLDAFDHQNYTLGALVKKLNLTRDPSRQAIISILFNLDNEFSQFNFGNLKVSTSAIQRKYETFDIFINLKPTSEGIYFEWIYNKDLFKAASIKRKLKEFEALLKGILEQPQLPIAQLPLLSNVEKEKLLTSWNQTNVDNFSKVCIFDLFKQQAHKTPNNIALVFENQSFTYADLLKKSEGFAGYLQQKGIKRGNKVGILLNRSSEMLITLLAVLKLGATYIPLDPINPKERLQGILEDVAANYLISHAPLTQQLPDFSGEVIYYETKKSYTFPPVLANGSNPQSTDLAYIIYTSGSTGKPKGIAIPHYAVIDHHLAIIDQFKVNQQDKILALASISFDPSVQDFFMPLFVGAQITIANQETVKDGFLLKELMASQQPTLMQATPSTWQMLLLANWEGNADLKILCGGEGLSKELAKKLLPRCKEVWNIYGPTETTIWSTCKQIDATMLDDLSFSYLPIGKALNNVKVYILDQQLQPVPIGVNGEIYIAGPGVAPLGYYNRPDLNEKAFLSNPFVREEKYARLYKTGDQARYLPNGDIEYLNRGDAQVKIRGYRIELGDIEAAIGQFKGVRDNRVVVRTSQNDKRLAAYLIVEQPQDFSIDLLKNYLKNQLPTYMIPAAFVLMGAFPMTPSRKVDRNQLPAPQWLTENKKLSPPSSPTEKVLAEIWAELLDYPAIGIHDDFFALGGHSLIAIKMMARIEKQLGRKVPLASLLQHSTIQQLAKLLDKKAEDNYKGSLVPIQTKGNKAPLYLIHGGGLHVLMFQTLAAQMGEDQPIYALQARGLNGEAEPLERIEDMAAHYIQEIERFNPNQPYILAGYSFGGLIAFEMAKQLKKSNKKLLKLCVFDTVIKEELTALDHSLSEKVAIVGKKIAWNLKDLIQHPQNNLSYRKYIYQRRLNNWKHKVFNGGKNNWSNVDNQLSDLVNKSNFEAWNHYKITPYEGDLYLFKAKEQRFFIKDKHYLGWGPYVKGNIHLLDVPGDHLNLFNPPNGVVVAQILREVLEQHG
jgi:amino acid adenylation domain-containing protein